MSASSEFIHYGRWWLRAGRWMALSGLMILMVMGHIWIGGLLIGQTNHTDEDILGADQKHNMRMALETRADLALDFSKGISQPLKDWLPRRTDGVVNPLWPWMAAWLADADHAVSGPGEVTEADRRLFNRGRWFHVGMTAGFLVLLGMACSRAFSLPAALNVVVLSGFGALLPRSAFFQPEPVYYIFFLLTWVCCLFALKQNSLWLYGLIGALSGLAYLAKGSIAPLLGVFALVSTLRWAWGWALAHWPGHSTTLWVRRNHLFGLFILAMCHFMTAGPRLAYAAEKFGSATHSYPGCWMWFDNFEEGFKWMNEHGSKESLLGIPPGERPSMSNYLAAHTREEVLRRLADGVKLKLGEFLSPGVTGKSKTPKPWKGVLERRGWLLGALVLLLAALVALVLFLAPKPHHAGQRLHPEAPAMAIFVVGSFVAYTLAYGFYSPIGRGERFMLSLYAPLALSLVWACEAVARRARRREASLWVFTAYECAQWLIFAMVSWRVIEILMFPHFKN